MTCPHCGESARFVEHREKNIVSLLGTVRFSRCYYHCGHCHHGHFPWDETLRLSPRRLSPGAQDGVCLAGSQEGFGEAAGRTLHKVGGLWLSESTVERTAEATGARLWKQLTSGPVLDTAQPYDWHKDVNGQTCGYLSVDATGILMQGDEGAKVEGRMVYVGMIYNPQPRKPEEEALSKPCDGVRYLAGLYTLDDLGQQLRRQGVQWGMDSPAIWIALTDGGTRLEEFH